MVSKSSTPCRARKSEKQTNPRPQILKAALCFAAEGFRIVPCHSIWQGRCTCKKKACRKPGKHPRIGEWTTQASTDPEQIRRWFERWPISNFGVATGALSGIVVLDFDGEVGRHSMNELVVACPEILQTRMHLSGGGGAHLFFEHPGFKVSNSASSLRPGMDVRGDEGLIILPPSVHLSRHVYMVANKLPISQLPEFVIGMLRGCHKESPREIKSNDETLRVTKQVEKGREANSEFLEAIPPDRIAAAIDASLPTRRGRRNRQVFQLARHLQAIDGITRDSQVIEFRQVVEQWLEKAHQQADHLGFSIDGDLEETWTDFQFAWGRVRYPEGCVLKPFFDRVAEMDSQGEVEPVVWNSLVYFRRELDLAMRLICGVTYSLSKVAGSEPFSLACNAAAEHFKRLGCATVDSKWVLRRLQTLSNDGILVCIDRGRPGPKGIGVTAKYRWIWTMRDPPPVQQY